MRKHQFPWCRDKFMSQSVPLPNVCWKTKCLSYAFKDSLLKKKKNLIVVNKIIPDLH